MKMLPRRKAQQEGDAADQVYRYQVREAEKSPMVVMYNVKQNMLLDKQISFLEKSKKIVVNRISVNQKVMFSAFNRRLKTAKMNQARMAGDIKKRQTLSAQSSQQSRFGLSPEEEDVLRRIWKAGALRSSEISSSSTSLDISNTLCLSADDKPAEGQRENEHLRQIRRLKPTSAVTPRREAQVNAARVRSKSAAPTLSSRKSGPDQTSTSATSEHARIKQVRIRTPNAPTASDDDQHDAYRDEIDGDARSVASNTQPQHPQNFEIKRGQSFTYKLRDPRAVETRDRLKRSGSFALARERRQCAPSLLELHKKKAGASDVMTRMHTLLDSMRSYSHDQDRIDRDHYTHAVEALARQGWGARETVGSARRQLEQDDGESVPQIPNLTVKGINNCQLMAVKQKVRFA